MSFESSGYRESRLLPESVENDLKIWANGSVGWFFLGLAIFGWLSLLSWSSQDMHLGMATRDLRNLFGPPGAIFSDFLISSLGLASMFLFLPPLIWGWKIKNRLPIANFKQRLILLPVSILLIAGTFGVFPTAQSWPLSNGYGGIFGDLIYGLLTNFISTIKPAFADFITLLLLSMGGMTAFLSSMELSFEDVTRAFKSRELRLPNVKRLIGVPKRFGGAVLGSILVMAKILGEPFKRRGAIDEADDAGVASHSNFVADMATNIRYAQLGGAAKPATKPMAKPAAKPATESLGNSVVIPVERPAARPMSAPEVQAFAQSLGERSDRTQSDAMIETVSEPLRGVHTDPWAGEYDGQSDEEEAGRRIAARFAPKSMRNRRQVPSPVAGTGGQAQALPDRQVPAQASTHAAKPAVAKPIQPQPIVPVKKSFFAALEQPGVNSTSAYHRPGLEMLTRPGKSKPRMDLSESVLRGNAGLLHDVLADFGIDGKIIDIKPGPVVTLFEFEPARGVKSSRVIALADDIARSMSAVSARVAVVPGRNVIGIELPNRQRDVVYLSELLGADIYTKGQNALPLALGKNIAGAPVVVDLARMPHLLIAGTTGSGKSVGINAMILSLLYALSPDQCKFIMIDPKMLELSVYNDIPHLLTPVVTDPHKAVGTLNWVIGEMEERYKNMSLMGVRSVNAYNAAAHEAKAQGRKIGRQVQTGYDPETGNPIIEEQLFGPEVLPYIVVVIDELADLMMVAGKEIEGSLQRLAQMARAAGIHLIMATQRPSVDVVTGTIKANFPTRISFKVASKIDSRTILAEPGAEQLLGHGDMLYSTGPGQMSRVHGPLVEDGEVEKIIQYLRKQGRPNYVEALSAPMEAVDVLHAQNTGNGGSGGDELFERAVAIVVRDQKVSTSYIQRRLSIGYNRAADLIDRMEADGLISPPSRTGKRQILMGESENFA